jgi:5-methyltetrahydrofolate--homocysteine methyltransferase
MGILLDRLAKKKLLVYDGAWGTMLQAAGLTGGACPEEWNVTHPEEVKKVAKAYQDAGRTSFCRIRSVVQGQSSRRSDWAIA